MELDDQLAALVAGELDDDTARALRARAVGDPAIARRLAQHEQLQTLLTGWDAPALSDDAVARLDRAVDDALAEFGDEPLASRPAPTGPLSAVPTPDRDLPDEAAATSPAADGVTDLAAARERRTARRGLPAWVPGATVAAALLAVVGTGVLAGGGLTSEDAPTADSLADAESADESDESAATGLAESDAAMDDGAAEDMAAEDTADEAMEESAALGPAARSGLEVAEGDLLVLLEPSAATTQSSGSDSDDAEGDDEAGADDAGDGEAASCVAEAFERDTTAADDREIWLLASGRYADRDAVFVVIQSPSEQAGDRYEVLAYDPVDCSLLARDETIR